MRPKQKAIAANTRSLNNSDKNHDYTPLPAPASTQASKEAIAGSVKLVIEQMEAGRPSPRPTSQVATPTTPEQQPADEDPNDAADEFFGLEDQRKQLEKRELLDDGLNGPGKYFRRIQTR